MSQTPARKKSRTEELATRKISPKQVGLLWARCAAKGIRGTAAVLDFLEFEAEVDAKDLNQLEDLTPLQLERALRTLEKKQDVA
jgi:hypothetical protein